MNDTRKAPPTTFLPMMEHREREVPVKVPFQTKHLPPVKRVLPAWKSPPSAEESVMRVPLGRQPKE